MAKKVTGYIKLQIPAGKATPAPPVGPALGQHGVNIVEFTKQFNARTADKGDLIIPVVITVYADRSFSFITKTPPAAELIKKEIGSAFPGSELREMEVKGRNLSEGVPRSFTISSNEVLEALSEPINSIVSEVKRALEETPPELGADIAERGMMLTGGGALLRDLDRLLAEETGLPVLVAEDPLTCVVRGCGMALENMDKQGGIFANE